MRGFLQKPLMKGKEMIIMTYNVRYANEIDGIYSWDNRKELLVETIMGQNPGILSLQEAKPEQLGYIDSRLKEYSRVGEGRLRDGKPDEHCVIYFKNSLFELQDSKTLWYSETPEVPGSMSWDTTLPRIYTYAILKQKSSGTAFAVLNTHLEHKGKTARLKSIDMLLKKAKEFNYLPVAVTGDFNMQEDYPGYRVIAEDGYLRDSRYISKNKPSGPAVSTNGFGKFEQITPIDFIFVNDAFMVNSHATIENNQGDIYPSDHYPIVCDIVVTNS